MKIFAVGWNYLNHNKEMNRALLPKEPVLFMKPDTALLKSRIQHKRASVWAQPE